jgi:hypothetical protein
MATDSREYRRICEIVTVGQGGEIALRNVAAQAGLTANGPVVVAAVESELFPKALMVWEREDLHLRLSELVTLLRGVPIDGFDAGGDE